jgi:hypothetical protein
MAVTDFQFNIVSGSRDKCIAEMDDIALQITTAIGGDPWMTVEDEVTRQPMTMPPQKEDDFIYKGTRHMIYQGPGFIRGNQPLPPDVTPQNNDKGDLSGDH